jgi:hypothetical protein
MVRNSKDIVIVPFEIICNLGLFPTCIQSLVNVNDTQTEFSDALTYEVNYVRRKDDENYAIMAFTPCFLIVFGAAMTLLCTVSDIADGCLKTICKFVNLDTNQLISANTFGISSFRPNEKELLAPQRVLILCLYRLKFF